MKNLILFSLFTLFIASCSQPDQTVTVNNEYELTLPGFLSENTNLHDEASLAYDNPFKEFYSIVIDEPITDISIYYDEDADIFEEYHSLLGEIIEDAGTIVNTESQVDLTIAGFQARQTERVVLIDGMEIFYFNTVVMTNTKFYQIVSWCLPEDSKTNKPLMEKIGLSFREL